MKRCRRIVTLSLVTLLLVMLTACDNRLTTENYDRLEIGMSYDEVENILGSPARCNDMLTVKHCRWGDERRSINVNFVAGQVIFFSAENLR